MPGLEMGSFPVEVGEEGYHHNMFAPLFSRLRSMGRRSEVSTS